MHKRIDRHILSKWTTQSQTNLKAGSTSFRISNLSTYLNNKKVTHMGKTKCKIFQHASHKGINHFCVVLNLYTSPCLLWMTHVKLLAYMCISTSKAKKVPQVLYAWPNISNSRILCLFQVPHWGSCNSNTTAL